MTFPVYLLLLIFALDVYSLEEIPQASAIRSKEMRKIQRAPVYKPDGAAPRAHGFKRRSTGVRRARPASASSPRPQQPNLFRTPLSLPVIPMPAMLPISRTIPASAVVPVSLPMVVFPSLMSTPTMPTFATIDMPTLPTLTMPPSFQRLMGITTSMPRIPKHEKPSREVHEEAEEEQPRRSNQKLDESAESDFSKSLSPVSSRLPKFVNSRKTSIIAPEGNADWIVPFQSSFVR